MMIQTENETRLEYLARVLVEFMEMNADHHSIEYDGTTCDGHCLAEDIQNEVSCQIEPPAPYAKLNRRWEYDENEITMIEERSIQEFRDAGLLLLTNQFLHIFGWALTVNLDDDGKVTKFYPAHCKFRGFDNVSTGEAYEKITKHLEQRMPELLKDCAASEEI